jgi:mannose-6-phosphate isomerase-like protein (cupin superfamily)
MKTINLQDKFKLFDDHWSPRVITDLNDYQVKLAKVEGEFVWHQHDDTDEMFLVIEGTLLIHFRDRTEVLNAGEMLVVPKGVEHKPEAKTECKIMLLEPKGVVNTGNDSDSELTAENDVYI